MTTNWKRTGTADGAGAYAPGFSACARAAQKRRLVRELRWKQDAVCGYAAADADLREAVSGEEPGSPADSTGSSVTRTIFISSRTQTQPQTRKETPNTTQKEKGKQTQNQVTISQATETLA